MITGHDLRRARQSQHVGLDRLSERIGRDKGHLSRVERGEREVTPALVADYERALGITLTDTPDVAVGSPTPFNEVAASTRSDDDLTTMRSFRAADLQLGGGHLYRTVAGYLQHELACRLLGGRQGGTPPGEIFVAAGGLAEFAGWMAHDGGRDDLARSHFERALEFARAGRDAHLHVHTLASLSHLANEQGRPHIAINLAQRGMNLLKGQSVPVLKARLLAMQARGHAGLDEPEECRRLLTQAEQALDRTADVEPSPWISGFDAGSMAAETFRCALQLGRIGTALEAATAILDHRPAPGRSRTLGHLNIAVALLLRHPPDVDSACIEIGRALDTCQTLASATVDRTLDRLRTMLDPGRHDPAIALLVDRINRRRTTDAGG